VILAALQRLARAYGKPPRWIDDQLQEWVRAFSDVDPDALNATVEDWIRSQKLAPTIADMLARVGTSAGPRPDGCRACMRTGWRTIGIVGTDRRGNPKAATYSARCDCALGSTFPGPDYRAVIADMRQKHSGAKVAVTTAEQPLLQPHEYLTEAELAQLEARRANTPRRASLSMPPVQRNPPAPPRAYADDGEPYGTDDDAGIPF